MITLGLTGSIGMGKSETARMFRRLRVPVYDADAAVHALYSRGGAAVRPIGAAFPGVIVDGAVDRQALGQRVIGDERAMRRLERITHPLLHNGRQRFLRRALAARHRLVVLDIPLLFETGGQKKVDCVAVVSAPAPIQRQRVLRRPNMTAAKLEGILRRQVADAEKRRRADYVIHTGLGKRRTFETVRKLVAQLSASRSRALRRRQIRK